MQTAFLIIISLIGSAYAMVTRQTKTALGLFIITLAFALQIPDLATGFWVDILLALSLIVFVVGIFIIVYKKKDQIEDLSVKEENTDENNETN